MLHPFLSNSQQRGIQRKLERLQTLIQRRDKLQVDVKLCIQELYPLGTIVEVKIGRAIIRGSVITNECWHSPRLMIKNSKTGKEREIAVGSAHVKQPNIVALP